MLRYVPFLECATTGTDTGFPFITVVPESVPVCWADPLHANNKTKNINPITFIFSPFLPIAEWFKTRQTSKVPGSSKCGVRSVECGIKNSALITPHSALETRLRGQRWLFTKLPLHRLSTQKIYAT